MFLIGFSASILKLFILISSTGALSAIFLSSSNVFALFAKKIEFLEISDTST